LLAHMVLVPAWTVAPALLLSGLVTTGAPHGWKGVLLSMGLGAGLIQSGGPATRGPLCLAVIGIGAAAPTGRVLSTLAGVVCCVLAWFCKGTTKDFKRRPELFEFLTTWRADYYEQAEVRFCAPDDVRRDRSCFGFHPHGCLSAGFTINGCFNPEFHKRVGKASYLCDANLRYKNPFFRMMCDGVRRDDFEIDAADKKTFLKKMGKGESIVFIPGGFQDAVAFRHGKDCTVLKRRKGFIKYCLQHGYRVHPVYTFGESETFYSFTGLRKLRTKISEYNVPMVAFYGWPCFPLLPRPQSRLLSYVGPALVLPHKPEPTAEDVDLWHGKYMEALVKLFDEKRAEAGWPDAHLELL